MASILPPIITTTASVATFPITQTGAPLSWAVVFSVPAASLGPSNVVFVETQVEFDHGSNPFKHIVSVGRQIIRTTSATATTGTPVTQQMVADVGPGEWSSVFSMMAVDSNIPAGNYYYNVVMFAYSAHPKAGETITIPSGCGDCSILIMSQ
ncbi:MAG: hypothetical protein K2X66_07160 [Cyanobacteria bacterium]|nr:hypothetical protein [Cyanobacteriota bacterium]